MTRVRAGITEDGDDSPAAIEHAYRWILLRGGILSIVLFILWPCLTLPARVFSKGYWTFWVALSMAWGAFSPGRPCICSPCERPMYGCSIDSRLEKRGGSEMPEACWTTIMMACRLSPLELRTACGATFALMSVPRSSVTGTRLSRAALLAGFIATIISTVLPLYEAREHLFKIAKVRSCVRCGSTDDQRGSAEMPA